MNEHRIKQLLEYLEEDPNDPFMLYALATEYNPEQPEKALYFYEKLIHDHPSYVATYYHLANLYLQMEDHEKARATFEMGIEQATQNDEPLLLRELKNAYNEFMLDF